MFAPFVYLLRDLGLSVSFRCVIEFFEAVEKGLVSDIDRLFLVSRLIFVKKVEHYDLFEKAFAAYFLGQTDRLHLPDEETILGSKPFEDWLKREIENGALPPDALHEMSIEELMKRFWETALAQHGEHHGGNRWIGTGGRSPWGHSGYAKGGIRVHGVSKNRSAMKVIGRRYIDYSAESSLSADNIRQALSMMKRMVPIGPGSELDVDETVYKTCKNGGEIEFVFERELRDRIEVMLLLDNGGYSMDPYISLVQMLFSKMRDQFKDLKFYYFHNCIYNCVYSDVYRSKRCSLAEICRKDKNTRLFVVGDANMAPSELFSAYGAIDYSIHNQAPGIDSLRLIADTFQYSVWLNPIEKNYWHYQSNTLNAIAQVFQMEDLTLNGLKNAVEYLKERE